LILRLFVEDPIPRILLPSVLPVPPGVARRDHGEVHVLAVEDDLPDDPPVAVALVLVHPDIFARDQAGQIFLRLLPEGLLALGGVDARQPDLVHPGKYSKAIC